MEEMELASVVAEGGEDAAAGGMQEIREEEARDVRATQADSLPEGCDALHGCLDGGPREPGESREQGGENVHGGDGEGESAERAEECCGGEEMDLADVALPAEAPGTVTMENADSLLSCGNFEHSGGADDDAVDRNADVAASSSALPSALGPTTEGLEVNEARAQQTDLKGWLKKG